MASSSPKYQWSKKIGEDILVVTGDNKDDFVLDVEWMKSNFVTGTPKVQQPIASEAPKAAGTEVCAICGSAAEIKAGISKAGKPYKIFKCFAEPELVAKGGHSRFLQ